MSAKCLTCGQKNWGQTGEYRCADCGLPRLWDDGCEPPEEEEEEEEKEPLRLSKETRTALFKEMEAFLPNENDAESEELDEQPVESSVVDPPVRRDAYSPQAALRALHTKVETEKGAVCTLNPPLTSTWRYDAYTRAFHILDPEDRSKIVAIISAETVTDMRAFADLVARRSQSTTYTSED